MSIIHDKGPKAERDRRKLIGNYDELVLFFRAKPMDAASMAKLTNSQLYRACEDLYNRQPEKAKVRYSDHLGITVSNPLSFRFFARQCQAVYRPKGLWKAWLWLTLPFRYPGFVQRSKAAAKAKGVNVRTGEELTPA